MNYRQWELIFSLKEVINMERGKTRMHHKNCGVGFKLVISVWSHMYGEGRREER